MKHASKILALLAGLVSQAASAERVYAPTLQLRAEERYDDDYRLNPNPGGSGQMMTKLTPRLGLEMKAPTQKLDSFYAADFLLRHGTNTFSVDHRAGLDTRTELSRRLRLDATAKVFRVTDPTSLPRVGLGRSFAPILYGRGGLGLTGRASDRVDLRTGYVFEAARLYNQELTPERTVRPVSYVHMPSLEAWYRTTRRLSLGAEYRYQAFLLGPALDQSHGAFAAVRVRLTPLVTLGVRGGPMQFLGRDGTSGLLPRASVELAREGQRLDLALLLGHDLVGASGSTEPSLWADFASAVFSRQFARRFKLYGAASYFRNGRPPSRGLFGSDAAGPVSAGYAVGGGLEYQLSRKVSFQASADRIAQLGATGAAGETGAAGSLELPSATRNVAAVRAVVMAF